MHEREKWKKKFYDSKPWRQVSALVKVKARGLCQSCRQAGFEVHHIIPLTQANVTNPKIALNPDNLMLLCTKCHNAKRKTGERKDVYFTEDGDLVAKTPLPPVDF